MKVFRRADRNERGPSGGGGADVRERTRDRDSGGDGIRCPRCRWSPRSDDVWGCFCGHAWNTFDTRGRCPECGERWDHTQCLRCHDWSPHDDWYADAPR